jgi:hypothetical protein
MPRHREISPGLVRAICKDLDVPQPTNRGRATPLTGGGLAASTPYRARGDHFVEGSGGSVDTAGRIQSVRKTEPSTSSAPEEPRPGLPMDESRLLMMRRVKAMTVEQRLQLFERLSGDAAWIRSGAMRIR